MVLISSSKGSMISVSITSGSAPESTTLTLTMGKSTSGNSRTDNCT